ncbi:MAG: hypothetical protein LLG04_18470 [Parachlamydia sp.]|nr:hypothetical protein [Parachlamydia sp.]
MTAFLLLFLSLAGFVNASEETAQMFPPRPDDPLRELRSLQKQNADLRKIVQTLEPYREMAAYLQLRLIESEQSAAKVQQGAASLMQANRAQAERDKQNIDRLQRELQAVASKCRQSETQLKQSEQTLTQEKIERQQLQTVRNQTEVELQQNRNRVAQSERLIQFLRERSEALQKENQSVQAALENCEKQLRYRPELEQPKPGGENLEKKLLSVRRELDDIRLSLETTQRQNENLNFENSNLKKQMQTQAKRLDNYEQTFLETITETQALQTRFQSLIDEKSAAIEKWRQANAGLQTQLDSAASINTQLRKQITALQAECEKK